MSRRIEDIEKALKRSNDKQLKLELECCKKVIKSIVFVCRLWFMWIKLVCASLCAKSIFVLGWRDTERWTRCETWRLENSWDRVLEWFSIIICKTSRLPGSALLSFVCDIQYHSWNFQSFLAYKRLAYLLCFYIHSLRISLYCISK